MKRIRNLVRRAMLPFAQMRGNTLSLIKFEIIYKLMTIFIFFPILSWMMRLLLIVNGTKVVAAFNASSLLTNPLTWVVGLVTVILLTIFASFERFAIVDTLHASKCGIHHTTADIFRTTLDLIIDNCRPRNWLLIPYCILILHFGSVSDASSITSFITIPGFIRESMEKYPYQKYLYLIGVAIAMILFMLWIFAIPIMMEEDTTHFSEACRKSRKMIQGRYFFQITLTILFWYGMASLFFFAGTTAFITVWYLLALWLTGGAAGSYLKFFQETYEGSSLILFIGFLWIMLPFLLASIQAAYYKRKEKLSLSVLPYTEEKGYFRKYRWLSVLVLGGCAVCIFFSGPSRYRQTMWMMNTSQGQPLIMAHRGYSDAAPENTLPAFEKAIDAGFTAAELDVQMTKDGTIVVLHDSNLKRTTGVDKNIWDVTWEEISDLDNGSFFSADYKDTRIPTLEEVLHLCKDKLFLNIEIKRTGHDDGIVEKVVDLILENEFENQCDITSQSYRTLEEVREIPEADGILTAYTSVIGLGDIQNLEAANIISIQETFATFENIEKIQNAGKRIFVWTVNEKETMEKLVSLNVDAILTNNPALCESVIQEYSSNVMNIVRRIRHALTYLA